MPIYRRVPKMGFHNPNSEDVTVINVGKLEAGFEDGETVDVDSLRQRGLVRKKFDAVKVLGDGELTKALNVQAHKFSASARKKIEDAGGSAEVV